MVDIARGSNSSSNTSNSESISPCLVARVLLEDVLGLGVKDIKDVLKCPERLGEKLAVLAIRGAGTQGVANSGAAGTANADATTIAAGVTARDSAQAADASLQRKSAAHPATTAPAVPMAATVGAAVAEPSSAAVPVHTHASPAPAVATVSAPNSIIPAALSSLSPSVVIAPPPSVSPSAQSSPSPAPALAFARALSVPCSRWVRELRECVSLDPLGSPFLDLVKNLTGSHYETLLASYLRARGVPFLSENDLRSGGLVSKTPDFRLLSPLMVHGHVVSWIDSKAQFADPATKRTHLETQLRPYVNRFGKGMVIYWFDFVEDEPDSCSRPLTLPTTATHSGGNSTTTAESTIPRLSCSAPAVYDNGDILLLCDFPSECDTQTLDQLLQAEMQMTMPLSTPVASGSALAPSLAAVPVSTLTSSQPLLSVGD